MCLIHIKDGAAQTKSRTRSRLLVASVVEVSSLPVFIYALALETMRCKKRKNCHEATVPVTTAAFSPKGRRGDLISPGSLTAAVYVLAMAGGKSIGDALGKGVM